MLSWHAKTLLPLERRDAPVSGPEVLALRVAIDGGDAIVTTGLVLQELLQGFAGLRDRKDIVKRFAALPLLVLDRQDYIDAADIRNFCRRAGVPRCRCVGQQGANSCHCRR